MSLPEIIGGKYRPQRVLGAGSTGTVYSVEHTFTGELLALKVMTSHLGGSPEAVARFRREALVVSKIRSQHVVRIFDADVAPELNGAPYLVMDLLEGVDLEQISEDKPVAPETVVDWLRQVADPVDKAHRIGIIHRDLKPENLFLTRGDDGTPLIKILDFGIARITSESMSIEMTQWGQLLGTPLYMAPEQARGDPTQIGPATDLYALGLIAYKLLAGTSYRTGTTLTVMLEDIVRGPLRAPSEVGRDFSPEFDIWFLRACHPDPTRRFASAEQQVEALARALDLPADLEKVAVPASGETQPFAIDVRSSLVSANAAARASLDVMLAAASATSAGKRMGATTGPSPLDTTTPTYDGGRSRRNRWRVAFFGAAALVVLLLLFMFSTRSEPPRQVAASPAPPLGSTVAVALLAPPVEVSLPPAAPQMTPDAAGAAPVEKPVARPVWPVRAAPARVWLPAKARAQSDDDPLSDQQ